MMMIGVLQWKKLEDDLMVKEGGEGGKKEERDVLDGHKEI